MIALRRATADTHAALDACLPVTAPDLTLAGYRLFLSRMLGVVVPTEHAIDAAEVPLDDWASRRRSFMLFEDLSLEVGAMDSIAWCEAARVSLTPDQALGAAYVLEGSTLGGRHIATAVRTSVGADTPLRWFEAYGDQVPTKWQYFRQQVNARADAGGDIDQMVAGAVSTFTLMHDWLLELESA